MEFEFFAPFIGSISTVSGDALGWVTKYSGALGVAAAVLTMFSTIIYTWVIYRILKASRDAVAVSKNNIDALFRLEAEKARAQVVVDIQPAPDLLLRIRNLGATPARDVRVRCQPPLFRSFTVPPDEARFTTEDILWLVPGEELVEYLGGWHEVASVNNGLRFELTVEYTCHDNERMWTRHSINLSVLEDAVSFRKASVADRLKVIADVLQSSRR